MQVLRGMTRRNVLSRGTAAILSSALPCPSIAQAIPRIVVIGGGFGGASCARALRQASEKLDVTLIEPNRVFTSCPFSNEVISGLRDIEAQQFTYDKIAAQGVRVVSQAATQIDPHQHKVTLADGTSLTYDRLVMASGIDLKFDALPGYDEAASLKMPHAWKAGEQTVLLRRQLQAMDDGGVVVIAAPASPSRCPPAVYERASLIAYYLKKEKPRSKILILDAKDAIPQQRLFENAWKDLYSGMIERISLSQGGRVVSVDPATRMLVTDFGNYTAAVANVIPPQKTAKIAELAGAADHTGWCPIDPVTFASTLMPDIHVIGDACIGGGIPKSASAANAEGKACARAIVNSLQGLAPPVPRLTGTCYSTVAPGYAFSLSGIYQPKDGMFAETDGAGSSPVDAPRETRKQEAEKAEAWFATMTGETFG